MATIIITASCVFLAGAFILYILGMLDCIANADFKLGNLIKEFIFQDYQNIVDSKLGKMIEEFDELCLGSSVVVVSALVVLLLI